MRGIMHEKHGGGVPARCQLGLKSRGCEDQVFIDAHRQCAFPPADWRQGSVQLRRCAVPVPLAPVDPDEPVGRCHLATTRVPARPLGAGRDHYRTGIEPGPVLAALARLTPQLAGTVDTAVPDRWARFAADVETELFDLMSAEAAGVPDSGARGGWRVARSGWGISVDRVVRVRVCA